MWNRKKDWHFVNSTTGTSSTFHWARAVENPVVSLPLAMKILGSGSLDGSCCRLEFLVWNITSLKQRGKVSDLTFPPRTQKNEFYNLKRCFYNHGVFVRSGSFELHFLYLPPWLISSFRDLSWLIQDSYCTLGDTTSILRKKLAIEVHTKKTKQRNSLDCVWPQSFGKSSGCARHRLLHCHIFFSWQKADSLLASHGNDPAVCALILHPTDCVCVCRDSPC